MNMRDADHDLAKGSELADRHRESRANQVLLLMSGHVNSLWAVRHFLHKTLRAIVPADVAHNTHKRQHLSLERRFPSAQVGTTHGRSERIGAESGRVCAFIGKSEEDISRWYSRVDQAREQKHGADACRFKHEPTLPSWRP